MAHGGYRAGAGRKPGSRNKTTIERQLRAAAGVKAALDDGLLPLDVMLRVMRGDEAITARQFEAAQAAAPYVHARLSAVDATSKGERLGYVIAAPVEAVDADEWAKQHQPHH